MFVYTKKYNLSTSDERNVSNKLLNFPLNFNYYSGKY